MQETLIRYFSQENIDLSIDEANIIRSLSTPINMERESILLSVGQIADFVVFIVEGIMRMYEYDKDGQETTKFFFKEKQFITNLDSYSSGRPSAFYIQTITSCKLLMIKKKDAEEFPKWQEIFTTIVQKELRKKIDDQYFLRNHKAREKYEDFIRQNGDIVNRVPLQYIASYLGIAPQSLSRIRRSR